MTYTKEGLNTFFEEVISIVDSCTLEKEIPNIKNFRSILYISFAAFLTYYGYENIDVIYESFSDTNYLLLDGKHKKSFVEMSMPAYVRTRYEEKDNEIFLEDYLNIIDNRNMNIKTWFNLFLHEMNHLINSKNNRIIDKSYIRSGISLYDVYKKNDINKNLNEAFNTLQTENIENIIYLFSQEKIVTPYFYQMLRKIKKCEVEETGYGPYPLRTSIIRPLYENERFKKIYEDNCIFGSIDVIEKEFDERTYKNAFQDLSDLIEQCNDDIHPSEQHETITKAKTIVKRYLVS